MDLQQSLRKRLSKEEVNTFVSKILSKEISLDEVSAWLYDDDKLVSVSWIISTGAMRDSFFFSGLLPQIWAILEPNKNESVIRCFLAVFRDCDIPIELEGNVYIYCITKSVCKDSPIAHKAFCMYICAKIALKYNELQMEVLDIAHQYYYSTESAAIKSSCKKVIKMLNNNRNYSTFL